MHSPLRRVAAPTSFGRDEALDVAKGFGIILVVVGHCLDGLIAANYFPASVLWPALAVYVIYLFHMPLFFVVSGHLAAGKHRPAMTTIGRMMPTIVYPYFLWSILEGLMLVGMSRYTNSHTSLAPLLKIPWIPIVPYWFLYALFFCHILYLATRRLPPLIQLLMAFVLLVAPFACAALILHLTIWIVFQITRGFFFFTVGVVTVTQVRQLGRWAGVVATALFIALAVAYYQAQLTGAAAAVLVLPVAAAGIVATLAWSRVLVNMASPRIGRITDMLAFFGRYSMSIYVMHIFFTAGIRIALRRFVSHPTLGITVLEITAATIVGVLAPLSINWVSSKLHTDKWLGLQHMEVG